MVVLNTPSLYTFQNRVAPGGSLFLNSSIIAVDPTRHDVRIFKIPASEIAEKLGISYETVHTYIRRIYEKLQVRTRTEAVAKFLRR